MKNLLGFLILSSIFFAAFAARKNVCYWGTWSHYRTGDAHFSIDNIDLALCTHFVYSFLGATPEGHVIHLDPVVDLELGYISRFTALKSRSPQTKFLFSVGGYSFGSEIFSRLASTAATRATFAQSVLAKINEFNFDGFDLDWEWPGQRNGSSPNDRDNFVLLCAEIHRVLQPAGKEFGIAVAAVESSAAISYDVPRVQANVDFIFLMTYDMHGSWNSFTGIHAALYAGPADTNSFLQTLNVHASVTWWLNQGTPRNKLVVGMPSYGRSFTLRSAANNAIGAPATGAGNPGFLLNEPGFLGYNEICQMVRTWGYTRVWQSQQLVPYAFNGNQWVGYDDTESIRHKLQYIIDNNLAGSMWWSIETEDFHNRCGNGNSPLIRLAQEMMNW
ncbi:hypothetical protein PVAND_011077 [Polypedilum vanderplanki]|uniref:chitinase n=1 Tax=Polypedilum vanderplanki TaxID=319348 RepID=A0A9J6CIH0_POLVA|nr:hypothetical protein PVAND_011077 [Polypedilum vanderplanki]